MPELSKTMSGALNGQVQKEMESAYLYLSMSMYCESVGLRGAGHWLRKQWEEEQGHAMKIVEHINDRGASVELKGIGQPQAKFGSLKDIFDSVLKHEQEVTTSIHRLSIQATEEQDLATGVFLQWFISEQVEEEKQVTDILDTIKLAEGEGSLLLMLDRRLAER